MSRLNTQQMNNARLIYQSAIKHGLGHSRALELVAAAYAESGLNQNATNKSSGAAGLFQLLSSGYVSRAKQLGGVYNPQANIDSILPDYVKYWQQHPNAVAGEAAAAVERSGMGHGFYAAPLKVIGGILGQAPPQPEQVGPQTQAKPDKDQAKVIEMIDRAATDAAINQASGNFLQTLIHSSQRTQHGQKADFTDLIGSLGQLAQTQRNPVMTQQLQMPMAEPAKTQKTPDQGVRTPKEKQWEPGVDGPHGTAGPQKVDSRLIALAHHFGLKITSGFRSVAKQAELYAHRSTSGSVAAPGKSFHNKGLAIDVAVTPKSKEFLHYAFQHPEQFAEVFYDPAGISIKNGKIVKWTIGGHSDHIHIAVS